MKKILRSRKYFALSAIILLITSIYVSCKKSASGDLPATQLELISEARSYFEDEVMNLPQLNDNNLRHKLNKSPLWNKAVIKKISLGDAVIVPIKYEKEISLRQEDEKEKTPLQRTSYLMIYRNKKNEIQAEWVSLMPMKKAEGKKFAGIINIEHWNGKPKRAFAVDGEGQALALYLSESVRYSEIGYKRGFECSTVYIYGSVVVEGYTSTKVVGSETYCTWNAETGHATDYPQQEEEGSTSETTPDDYQFTIDCNNDVDGSAEWNENCRTCLGGNTGIDACPKEVKIDTGARKCLDTLSKGIISSSSVLTAIHKIFTLETNSNNVAGMINRISQSTDWDVIIKEGNITSEVNFAGDTIETNATTTATQGKVYITFNKSYLNQATNLSIARTMIHELMHSYFTYGVAMISDPGYGKFVEANDLLFKKNGNPYNDQNDSQHEQIAIKYVNQMSSLLEAYAISAGIQSPDPSLSLADYCKDLAWGGLKDTKAYRKYATDKTRIDKHLKSEAKNDVNSTKKKGC